MSQDADEQCSLWRHFSELSGYPSRELVQSMKTLLTFYDLSAWNFNGRNFTSQLFPKPAVMHRHLSIRSTIGPMIPNWLQPQWSELRIYIFSCDAPLTIWNYIICFQQLNDRYDFITKACSSQTLRLPCWQTFPYGDYQIWWIYHL